MERVAILGLGLMGSSLGLALKKRGFTGTVAGYARRAETRKLALEQGVADEVFESPADAVASADIVVLCLPILRIEDLLRNCLPGLKDGAIITDVGSTKQQLAVDLSRIVSETSATFIGSHPIAGSEKTGLESGDPDLYERAVVVITPPENTDEKDLSGLKNLWRSVGSMVVVMTPEKHDRVMSKTSHLPHMAATALAATVGRHGDAEFTGPFCGTGFKDTTRIADGSPDVWVDIAASNTEYLLEDVRAFRKEIEILENLLERRDMEAIRDYLTMARDRRRALMDRAPDGAGFDSV
ncbi:MAG: prephenate dehydrogenase [Verrucomicrobia bacterium]|nr:prephenate dehydrogenase [Verrucomicrobiota bacterium]